MIADNTTQCPACQTRFKVSEAQLSAAQGLVRCGRCAHIFNARDPILNVQSKPTRPHQAAIDPDSAVVNEFELDVPDFDPAQDALPTMPIDEAPYAHPFESAPFADRAAESGSAEDRALFEQALQDALQRRPAPPPLAKYESSDQQDERPAEEVPASMPLSDERATFSEDLSLEPQPQTVRSSTATTVLWVLASVLGVALLLGQLVFYNRTAIASQIPPLRATLEAWCHRVGCHIPFPMDQNYLRTEWSELAFVPEHSNLIQLSAILKNHAAYPQAFPMLEMTLKDAQDHIVIRKVFTPKEYLGPQYAKMSSFAAHAQIKITMKFDIGSVHAQGYSLYWFYT